MKSTTFALSLALAMAVAGHTAELVAAERAAGRETGEGARSNPAWSPDGKSLAFQELRNGTFSVGVMDIASRQVTWVEDGPGQALYPTWTPSGGLLYTYGHDTLTALSGVRTKSTSGFGLRLWEKGVKTDLTTGRFRDYTPSVSPDGKTIYFTSSRWAATFPGGYLHMSSDLATLDLATRKIARWLPSPGGDNAGVAHPDVSPDGKYLAWSQLDAFLGGYWYLRVARIEDPHAVCDLTDSPMIGHSPRWSPDGRHLTFTGYRQGDPGWCVYVVDSRTGAVKCLVKGENPVFSPDGGSIAYDRDGRLHIRKFGEDDRPKRDQAKKRVSDEAARILWKAGPNDKSQTIPLPAETFTLGAERTVHVRMTGVWNGKNDVQQPVVFVYGEHDMAMQFFIKEQGTCYFSTRDSAGGYVGVKAVERIKPGVPFTLVGVRSQGELCLSLNGAPIQRLPCGDTFVALDHPRGLRLNAGYAVEVGVGWPSDMPHDLLRKEVFK